MSRRWYARDAQVGSFLQTTGTVGVDLPVPGNPYSCAESPAVTGARWPVGNVRRLAGIRPGGRRTRPGRSARWVATGMTIDDVDERSEEAA
ncbi:hypothetical protein GCM10029963_69990 [Micromonospora andamanensis]